MFAGVVTCLERKGKIDPSLGRSRTTSASTCPDRLIGCGSKAA